MIKICNKGEFWLFFPCFGKKMAQNFIGTLIFMQAVFCMKIQVH